MSAQPFRAKHGLKIDQTTAPTPHTEGVMYWDDVDKTLAVQTINDTTLQVGQELFVRARNTTGSTIVDGMVVRIQGAQGDRPTIVLAQANNKANIEGTIGVVTHDIPNATDGFVTLAGLVRNIPNFGAGEGDEVWLSDANAGQFVNGSPALPSYKVRIGYVTRIAGGNCDLLVSLDSRCLESNNTGITGATRVGNIVQIGQADYTALVTKDPNTVYIINGA